ncbi:MAG: DUF899 family protein [Immundisolibacteraceae bacterium]|nr:DUF899 family protein [Immundisolibacteraceae bacterium]
MSSPKIVDQATWLQSRLEHLKDEKEFNRLRDKLSAQRRELPWVTVEKQYLFDTAGGQQSLADLFGDHDQLIVQHFMYGPDWDEGCPSCSFWQIVSVVPRYI